MVEGGVVFRRSFVGRIVFRRRFLSGSCFRRIVFRRFPFRRSFVDIHFRNIIKFVFNVFE